MINLIGLKFININEVTLEIRNWVNLVKAQKQYEEKF